jgi:hypothetical protein
MNDHCEAHEPTSDECDGALWECRGCGLTVCANYGADDNDLDECDACWYAKHKGIVPIPECV